jgi:CBS domain-containing protein
MKIAQIMTRDIQIANPQDTLQAVAQKMASTDTGFLPVGDNDRLVGMVTDRDIVIRGVAKGLDGNGTVQDVMTRDVKYCFENDEVEDVIMNMGDIQVRRLVVLNDDKRLSGVVSLADTVHQDQIATGVGLSGVVRPGGHHNQSVE